MRSSLRLSSLAGRATEALERYPPVLADHADERLSVDPRDVLALCAVATLARDLVATLSEDGEARGAAVMRLAQALVAHGVHP